jgi:FkbM family methyltransferase
MKIAQLMTGVQDLTLGRLLVSFMVITRHVVESLASGHAKRFILLSPPVSKNQAVWDKTLKRIHNYKIESWIDWQTGYQVFAQEAYGLQRNGLGLRLEQLSNQVESQDHVILDLGGNIGLASLYFALLYPNHKILCVEMDESNSNLANLNLEGLGNVSVIHAAVSSKTGMGHQLDPGLGSNAYRLDLRSGANSQAVRLVTVEQLLDTANTQNILIAKVDIEGSEADLFESNANWVDLSELIILEPHDWLLPGEANSKNFIKALANKNRDFLIYGENIFSIRNP